MECSAMGEVSGVAEMAASIGICCATEERRGGWCALPLPVSMAVGVHSFCAIGAELAVEEAVVK